MQKKLNEDFIDSYCEKFASKIMDSVFAGDKISITGQEILKVTPSKQTNVFILKLIFSYWQGESKKLESPFFNYENESVQEALAEFMNILSQNIEVHKDRFQLLLNNAVKDTIYLAASPQAFLEIDLDGVDIDKIDDEFINESLKYVRIYKKDIENFLSDMRGLSPDEAIDELVDEFEPFSSTEGLNEEAELLSEVLPLDPEKVLSENLPEDFSEFDDEVFDNDDESEKDDEPKDEAVVEKEQPEPEEEQETVSSEESEEPNAPEETEESAVPDEQASEETSNELRFQAEEKGSDSMIHPGWADKLDVLPESMKWGDEGGKISVEESEPVVEEPGADQEMSEPFEDETFPTEPEEAKGGPDEDPLIAEDDGFDEVIKEPEAEKEEPEDSVEEKDMPEEEPKAQNEEMEDESEPEDTTINDQFEVSEKTVVEHHEEEKSSSLMSSISVNHQFMFVKELFKDDQVSFQNALYDLEEYNSFDEAVEFLVQGYAKEFEWDMQSNEVKELLKVLFRKYRD